MNSQETFIKYLEKQDDKNVPVKKVAHKFLIEYHPNKNPTSKKNSNIAEKLEQARIARQNNKMSVKEYLATLEKRPNNNGSVVVDKKQLKTSLLEIKENLEKIMDGVNKFSKNTDYFLQIIVLTATVELTKQLENQDQMTGGNGNSVNNDDIIQKFYKVIIKTMLLFFR